MASQGTYRFSLEEVMAQLTAKITELEGQRDQLDRKVREGRGTAAHEESLKLMNEKLKSAYEGQKLLMDCCCVGQFCNYEV